jgi:hypothetical protein
MVFGANIAPDVVLLLLLLLPAERHLTLHQVWASKLSQVSD